MTRYFSGCIVAAILASLSAIAFADPSTTPTPITFVGQHYEGVVAQVDGASQSGTLTTRFAGRSLPFRITDSTRIWKTERISPQNLQIGDKVMIVGRTTKADNSIEPYLLDVIPALPSSQQTGLEGKRNVAIFATITAINPDRLNGTVTVVDRAGQTLTITTSGYRFLVGETVLGDFSDLAPGVNIKMDGKVQSNTMVADRIVLQVNLRARKNGRRSGLAANTGPANAPAVSNPTITDGDFSMYDLL